MDYPKTDTKAQSGPDISGLLQPGEQVLWQGQPTTASIKSLWQIFMLPLLVVLIGVPLSLAAGRIIGGEIPSLELIAAIFGFVIVVGTPLAMLFTIVQRRSNANIYYWLTNQRAIIIRGPLPMSDEFRTTIIKLAQIDAVRLVSAPSGNGSISFGRREVVTDGRYASANDSDYTFSNIPDVAHVYQLVQQAQLSAGKQD